MLLRGRISSALAAVAATITWALFALRPPASWAQTNSAWLSSARQVHQLSSEEARRRYPVRVPGVVTFCDESIGQLFIQDETGGIFVEIAGDYGFRMRSGQLLAIEGVSAPGGFAPDIEPRQIRLLGEGALPEARPVTYEQMATGQEDCNWVAFSGIVRSAGRNPFTGVGLSLAGGGGRVMVPIKSGGQEQCARLLDAEVTVRGVCIAHFNRKGQLIQVAVQVSTMDDILVRKAAPLEPFAIPPRKISDLLQYAPGDAQNHRVKVSGVVTLQRAGESLFIADETQGLYIQTSQTNAVEPGDRVEVLGFARAGEYISPVLEDAVFRKVGTGRALSPLRIAAEDGDRDTNHAALVQIEAVLLDRVQRQHEQLLELRSHKMVFSAQLGNAAGQDRSLAAIPDGSRVLVTGICLVPEEQNWLLPRQRLFSLVLRSAADVMLLERPSWWTVRHMLWVLAGTLAMICASLVWVAVLRRQVRAQTRVIAEKIQREAALEERTRIARDLHDDLGASLTHISFLSEVARKERRDDADVEDHLREISGSTQQAFQSLDEIVWVVNPKNDTLDGLTSYICQFAGDFFRGTPTRCRFDLPARLPDAPVSTEIRNNLFLAIKEAFNNVRKHAQASEVCVRITLTHAEGEPAAAEARRASRYCLSIEDNGRGFSTENRGSGRDGLSNMQQRLEQIRGRFEVQSTVGQGTKLRFTIPV